MTDRAFTINAMTAPEATAGQGDILPVPDVLVDLGRDIHDARA